MTAQTGRANRYSVGDVCREERSTKGSPTGWTKDEMHDAVSVAINYLYHVIGESGVRKEPAV